MNDEDKKIKFWLKQHSTLRNAEKISIIVLVIEVNNFHVNIFTKIKQFNIRS